MDNNTIVRRPIIAANWKLHKTIAEATQFIDDLSRQYTTPGALDVILAAPFTMLAAMRDHLTGTPFYLAAQDVFWETQGAYTGEVSASMLCDAGCTYVIIGHSERRQYFGETDATVDKKISAALRAGLHPIVCIGESLQQRQANTTFAVLEQQIRQGLAACRVDDVAQLVVAYEPLWAIGTGVTATPEQAQEVHRFIRTLLGELWGEEAARAVRLQYGGSVNAGNIQALMAENDIDGALVGGASLEVGSFVEILSYGRARTC